VFHQAGAALAVESLREVHKRQVGSPDTLAEALGFGHKHSEVERLIL